MSQYYAQKKKYRNRSEKFMMAGVASVVAIVGVGVAAPFLGAMALPAGLAAITLGNASLAGVAVNKLAESWTSPEETQGIREKLKSKIIAIRDATFGRKKKNALEI